MVEAIRRHFREYGGSPSHGELSLAVGIRRTEVGRVLRQAAAHRLITLQLGTPRGIGLPDRGAMLSDCELEITAHSRGARMVWPAAPVLALANAYHVERDTDFSLPFMALVGQIDTVTREPMRGQSNTEQCTGSGASEGPARDDRASESG